MIPRVIAPSPDYRPPPLAVLAGIAWCCAVVGLALVLLGAVVGRL